MGGLNRGDVRKPNAKSIAHRLLVVARGVEFETVDFAAGIRDDCGGSGGNKRKSVAD